MADSQVIGASLDEQLALSGHNTGDIVNIGSAGSPRYVTVVDGKHYTLPSTDIKPATALQDAGAKKDISQATKSNIVTLYGNQKFMIQTDDQGNPVLNPDTPGIPYMTPLQDSDSAKAY